MQKNRIREVRQAQGMKCADLSRKSGLPYMTVNKAELGYSNPCQATINALAKALNVKIGRAHV